MMCVTYVENSCVEGLGNPLLSAQAFAIAAIKSKAVKGIAEGPVSRSILLFSNKILLRMWEEAMLLPMPRRMMLGMIDVNSEPME